MIPAGARCDVVVNPSAGRGRAARLLPRVLESLRAVRPDLDLMVVAATDVDDAERACRRAVGRAEALVVMGGDGMAHLGINACAGTDTPLGLLPAGSGNDMCRGFGLAADLREAVANLGRGESRRVDLARVVRVDGSQRWVGCVVSTGFDSRVALRAARLPVPLGPLGYPAAALGELRTFSPLRYRLRLDGQTRALESMAIFVCNGEYFGGGMRAAPDADVTDGLLDVTIIHPVSRGTLLRLLPQLYSGRFVRHRCVERVRAGTVDIDGDGLVGSGDGEALGDVPLQVTTGAAALTVLGYRTG